MQRLKLLRRVQKDHKKALWTVMDEVAMQLVRW